MKTKRSKQEKLEVHGWKIGDEQDFLGLSNEEMEHLDIKLALSQKVRQLRLEKRMTQEQTARLIGSSQSRVAKIEARDPTVSIDLQVRSLITLGASRDELAQATKSEKAAT